MSSDPFDLLGLDRNTATDADIRRAYAERLKITRPDEDRAGFMALRAAFERARQDVRWRDEYTEYEEDGEDETCGEPQTEKPANLPEPDAADDTALAPGLPPRFSLGDIANYVPPGTSHSSSDDDDPETDEHAEELAGHEARANAAMEQLIDRLTATGKPPALRALMEIIDSAEVGGIEEYQSMQWQVRQFLCDRTGLELDPPVLRAPDWLTLESFDSLDQYYGWTRQPAINGYVRRMNDWLVRLRRELAGQPPAAAANLQDVITPSRGDGSQIWLWIGAGILLFQVVRFVAGGGG